MYRYDFLVRLPNDVRLIIDRLIHNVYYRIVLHQYSTTWIFNIGYEDFYDPSYQLPTNYDDHGFSLSFIKSRTEQTYFTNVHYFRNLSSFGGAFTVDYASEFCWNCMCECEEGTCDAYASIRSGSVKDTRDSELGQKNRDDFWEISNSRFITALKDQIPTNTGYDRWRVTPIREDLQIPLPKRYRFSNGGFRYELKYIPFDQR